MSPALYTQIVVGTDGSKTADAAVDTAIELARVTGATLHVVYAHKVTGAATPVSPEVGFMPVDIVEANRAVHEEGERLCARVVERAERAGVRADAHCVGGDPADALIRVAEDAHADLIVVGNHGMSGKRRLLGSVPNKVSHHCPTSVLIVDTREAREQPSSRTPG